MENASKALIMAAEILIGVILITIFVGLYHAWKNVADDMNNNMELTRVQEFNTKFEKYKNKELTVYDIITIVNMVNEFNYPDGYGKDYGNNKDDIEKIEIKGINIDKATLKTNEFIKDNNEKVYTIEEITYNEKTAQKLIKSVKFKEK